LEEWLKRDPIDLLKARMIADGQLDDTEFDEMKGAAETLVFESIEFAKSEPYPPLEELLTDIYYEK
jgi:TPP-dependent pyruvate/acetoin dehydrogenase alpha subunit